MQKWHDGAQLAVCAATIGCTSNGEVFPIRCKQWNCPTCAAINARLHAVKVANGIYALIAAGVIPYFVTLTLPGNMSKEFAFAKLADMWEKMRERWQWGAQRANFNREVSFLPKGVKKPKYDPLTAIPLIYAAFVELQGRGVPHFHIVSTYAPSEHKIKDWAVQSGMGYQVKVERVKRGAGVAWYISKYAGKTNGKMGLPKGFRRVRYSEQFPGLKFRLDERDTAKESIVKRWDESAESFITRARLLFGVDIRNEVYTIADTVADDKIVQWIDG